MQKANRWYDPIITNIYFFALSTRSSIMTPLLLPLLVQTFVGEGRKGTYYGLLRLVSLMVALAVQAIAGIYSDHSTSRFGKRRPYIFISTLLEIVGLIILGLAAATLSGISGYWALFAIVVISMITSNFGHAALQGLIPDNVSPEKYAFYSATKSFFEVPLPIFFVFSFMRSHIESQNYWSALVILMSVYIICGLLTMFVREKPQKTSTPVDKTAISRVLTMTVSFTLIILLIGEATRRVMPLILQSGSSLDLALVVVLGLAGMLIAVFLGVISSIRISLGSQAKNQRNFTWWVISRLSFLVGVTNLSSFLLYFIQERFPEAQGVAAISPVMILMITLGVSLLLGTLVSARLMSALGMKRMLILSGLAAVAGTSLVIIALNVGMMVAGATVCGIATGWFYATSWALGTSIVPKGEAGRYLGLSNLAGAGAGAIGAYIGGPIGDSAGFFCQMVIYGLMFLFSVIAVSRINFTPMAQNSAEVSVD